MFLHTLSSRQQDALLSLARQFIEADAHLSEEEKNLLELLASEAGRNPEDEIPLGQSVSELLAQLDGRQAQAVTLLELIGIGHADGEFDPAENQFVHDAARTFGVSDDELAKMTDWVRRQLSLAREVCTFWDEPEG
jgi:uncharacterized tellurite resistance protein B-like protein